LVIVAMVQIYLQPQQWLVVVAVLGVGLGLSYLVGKYFDRCLGGHTGDTYGAVVEWTEAICLCLLTFPVWYR
jgi:adenosylcobinamide-GDP ribazoletransferase